MSRNGVAPYRGEALPLDSIAGALGTGTLIRGSVEPLGDRIRVSVHLVEGLSGADFDRGVDSACPVCGSKKVEKTLMVPALSRGGKAAGPDAEQDVVRLRLRLSDVVEIVGGDER